MTEETKAAAIRVGIVSDTHGLLRPWLFQLFADVDHILHAGDVGSPELLTELEALAPVTAVWGNTDGWEIRDRVPEIAELTLGDVRIVVVHGQQFGSPTPAAVAGRFPKAGLIVFGHSHKPVIERRGSMLCVNPGSAGARRFQLPVSAAVAEINGEAIEAKLVTLDR
jgi:putative phosphoesterase